MNGYRASWTTALVAGALAAGCAGGTADIDSSQLMGAPDDEGTVSADLTSSVEVGATLLTTSAVNLRSGAASSNKVLHVIAANSKVTALQSAPSHGWFNVSHNGVSGWAFGAYLKLSSGGSSAASTVASSGARANAIVRAKSGLGYSYFWGHGSWGTAAPTSSTKGYCSGSCPSCRHSGRYGADCSGYIAKIWQLPSSNSEVTVDEHPFSTLAFDTTFQGWHNVTRASAQPADAMVYNSNGHGHMVLYESGDAWGQIWSYEARGCATNIVHNLRSLTSSFKAISHNGW